MKLRYLLPFYLLLIAVSLCCRKISSEKENATKESVKEETVQAAMAPAEQPITGTLELDEATSMIYADLYINVPNEDFKFDDNFMPLQVSKDYYKGIAFRYHDAINNMKNDGNGTVPLHVQFNFKNDYKWVENDSVRVMSLNEEEESTFTGLKQYFEERMEHFKNSATTLSALMLFNEDWNTKHPENPVYPVGEKDSKKHFTPRLTKDDSILLLKRKK